MTLPVPKVVVLKTEPTHLEQFIVLKGQSLPLYTYEFGAQVTQLFIKKN